MGTESLWVLVHQRGGLLWLTKNRPKAASGVKKKWDRLSCLPPNISVSFALRRESVLGEQTHGHLAQVPDDAEPGEDLQRVVGDVDLPPEEALARRGHEVMMVVVPAFAERQQRQQPVVLAGVGGLIAPRTKEVRERIDRKRIVPEHHGADAEAPHKQRPSADEHQRGAQGDRR